MHVILEVRRITFASTEDKPRPMKQRLTEWLRSFKLTYQVYNLFQRSALTHNLPHYRRYGLNKSYFSSLSSVDFAHLEGEKNLLDVQDSREELPKDSAFQALSSDIQESLLPWSEQGYAVLRGFFSPERVAEVNEEIESLLQNSEVNWRYGDKKIMFAIHRSAVIRRLGADPALMTILRLLMGKGVDLFQSINFLQASEQRTHSDSIHMTTFPYGNLIAVWIALEPTDLDNGPLHYYPGSHKLPYVMNADFDNVGTRFRLGTKTYTDYEDQIEAIIAEQRLQKQNLLAQPGDLLIWHANLLHGGDPLRDSSRTRKSVVFHYYAEGAICFHEVTQRPTLKRLSYR